MAWTKGRVATIAVVVVIILSGAITILINSGAFGNRGGSATMTKLMRQPGIYTNGINNAFHMADPLYTYPNGDETTHQHILALFKKFHAQLDPARALKSDRELTEEDVRTRTLIVYGSPENHSLFRRIRDRLPLVFENDGVVVGRKKYLGRDVGAIFVCPNPLSTDHLMIIYGTVSPTALRNMNGVYHGPTDYVIFNDTTRNCVGMDRIDCFLLMGTFDKSDPVRWRVDEIHQLLPPDSMLRATEGIVSEKGPL
jgi:hypothetical protein